MSDFRQTFLSESIGNLSGLRHGLAADFSENLRQEAFRIVHSIKGGAQVFGLQDAAQLADELENALSGSGNLAGQRLLLEGIERLTEALRENDTDCHADFLERLQSAAPATSAGRVLLTNIPPAVFRNFSSQERNATVEALRAGKHIYCAEIGFESANFADEYRNLRKVLSEKSEVIASLPSEKHKAAGRIGFLIFLASSETVESLQSAMRGFDVEISSHACSGDDSKYLYKMLLEVAAHGEKLARRLEKQISVTILTNDIKLSAAITKAFFDILLHLVRNAVDHGIEKTGSIDIRLFVETEGINLTVADTGKGIDLAKVHARAVEKKLISADSSPADDELLAMIFAPEFSTATRVTEISGRGVGLDAVKAAVEELNGKISVRNRKANGTIFEIFVPTN
jgi:chemotaxis protein histidine kinase CheA